MKAVVTVVGKDKKGIIAKVSNVLFENDVNIQDISQTIMQDMFTMIMLVQIDNPEASIQDITEKLNKVGEELEVSIHIQREEIFSSMHRI
jgi:ACT domain-containing protein